MQAEETVSGVPGLQEGLALFEECGDPAVTDVGIKGILHIVDHPEDGLPALGLTEVITLGCAVHLVDSQVA